MKNNIAYCGLDCDKCEARIATVNNDDELRKKVAEKWSEMNKATILPEDINCEGCKSDGKKFAFCESMCPIRNCIKVTDLPHCGKCEKFTSCEKIKMIIDHNEKALEELKK